MIIVLPTLNGLLSDSAKNSMYVTPDTVDVIVIFEFWLKFHGPADVPARFAYESPISTSAMAEVQALTIWMIYGTDTLSLPEPSLSESAKSHSSRFFWYSALK